MTKQMTIVVTGSLRVNNPKPELHNINAHNEFGENPLTFTQVIIQKWKNGRTDVLTRGTLWNYSFDLSLIFFNPKTTIFIYLSILQHNFNPTMTE